MFCTKCGKELPEGANVCPNCGEKIEREVNFNDVFNDVKDYAGQKAWQASKAIQGQTQQASASIQGKYQEFREEQKKVESSRKISDVHDLFVSSDEEQKAVIGGGYLSNLLSGGGLSKGFGILTNRRMYYRGKSYHKVGGRYMKTNEDCTLDLQDITSSGFTYTRRLWALILAILFGGRGILGMFVIAPYSEGIVLGGILLSIFIFLAMSIIFVLVFILLKKVIYTVTFAGGCLGINVSFFGISNVRDFDKALHKAKDERLAEDRLGRGNS